MPARDDLFQQKYAPEDVEAVVTAKLTNPAMTYRTILELARQGKLHHRPPFDMPLKTAQEYVSRERKRRSLEGLHPEATRPAETVQQDLQRWAMGHLLNERDEIDRQTKTRKIKGETRVRRVTELVKAMRSVTQAGPAQKPEKKATQPPVATATPTLTKLKRSSRPAQTERENLSTGGRENVGSTERQTKETGQEAETRTEGGALTPTAGPDPRPAEPPST